MRVRPAVVPVHPCSSRPRAARCPGRGAAYVFGMGRLIHLVADHWPGDLVHAQLVQQLLLALPGASVLPTRVAEGDTVAAGFCVAQLALSEGPGDRIVLHDVASATAAGEPLYGAHTRAGVVVIGPNTGWSWSFIAGEVSALCELDVCVDAASRGGLARAVSHVARRHPHAICEVLEDPPIPAMPERVVAYVDGDGNVETDGRRAAGRGRRRRDGPHRRRVRAGARRRRSAPRCRRRRARDRHRTGGLADAGRRAPHASWSSSSAAGAPPTASPGRGAGPRSGSRASRLTQAVLQLGDPGQQLAGEDRPGVVEAEIAA